MTFFFEDLLAQRRAAGAVLAAASLLLVVVAAASAALVGAPPAAALSSAAVCGAVLLAARRTSDSAAARCVCGVALMAQVSLIVGGWAGRGWQLDWHMAYFAALGLLAIFADWSVILVAAITVALHHLTLSFLLPSLVFYGGGGIGRVLLHAVILIVEAAALVWSTANNAHMLSRVNRLVTEVDAADQLREAQEAALAATEAEAALREEAEQRQREAAAKHATVLGAMRDALRGLAEGDLGRRIAQPFAAEYEPLRTAFNEAVAGLRQSIVAMQQGASALREDCDGIARQAAGIADRTGQQAAHLEETAAALDEVTATVKRTAEGANEAAKTAATARREAEQSGEIVSQAVRAMVEIQSSAEQIGAISAVIDEIAFQTNLLALNAGVEAARADESGKGFAVVAAEVRTLAQRSADAAKEIKGPIARSTAEVASGVDLVQRTGQALGVILAEVARMDELLREIAAASAQQSAGLEQVNVAVGEMDRTTQQNAASLAEVAASADQLRAVASSLHEVVLRFRTLAEGRQAGGEQVMRRVA